MKTKADCLNILREYKTKNAGLYGILRMGLFGSVARGEQTNNSDVDVLVEARPMSLFTIAGIKQELEDLFGMRVDLVRVHKKMNSFFIQQVEKDVVYV